MPNEDRFQTLPPPERNIQRGGPMKWPWFSARRRGLLLEDRVSFLEARVVYLENYLLNDAMRRAAEK